MSRRDRKKKAGSGWVVTRACPRCGGREGECGCESPASEVAESPSSREVVLRLRREKRRGKAVIVVAAAGLGADVLKELCRDLKGLLATGGSVKGEEIELQGEHQDRVRDALVARGYRVKG